MPNPMIQSDMISWTWSPLPPPLRRGTSGGEDGYIISVASILVSELIRTVFEYKSFVTFAQGISNQKSN